MRWRRGDALAYLLRGPRIGDQGTGEVVGTVPVSGRGWVDLADLRTQGEAWLRGPGRGGR